MAHTNGVSGSNLLQTLLTQTDGVNLTRTTRSGAGGTASSIQAQDRTQFSTVASALLRAPENDSARAEKIQTIQAAIAKGTYSVSSNDVAEKLIQSLQS